MSLTAVARLFSSALLIITSSASIASPLPFRRAVELAARHSGAVAIAAADQQKAYETYVEARDMFLPQVMVGSGLGYSAGFPLSLEGAAPSVFNATTQQFVFNPAQRAFIKSTKAQWNASALSNEDQRKQSMLDAAVAYAELAKTSAQLQALKQQQQSATRLQDIETQRVNAGVDSPVLLTRAKLNSARTRMRVAELEGSAVQLRKQLADLTGLPEQEIEALPESIPPIPDQVLDRDAADAAVQNSLRVKIADQQVLASQLKAEGERKQKWPAIDLVGQYALLAKFNNYDEFYRKFQRNNATIGVAIRVPLLNFAQKARAAQAEADALKVEHQAAAVRSQVSAETLKLQSVVNQVTAARDVAQLEFELARADTNTAESNVQAGKATLGDVAAARLAEEEKFGTVLDATFELQKSQLQLLRATDELERWALVTK